MYGSRRRRTGFRSIRGRYRRRPTAFRAKRVSWFRRRRAHYSRKWLNPNTSKQQFVKITWSDTYTMDAGAATYSNRDFRLNSIFDPDATGAGGTPSAYAQYAQLYKAYKVVAAKVETLTFNTGSIPVLFGFTCQNDEYSTPGTGRYWQQLFCENGSAKWQILQPSTYGSNNVGRLKWFGRIKPLLGERYAGDNSCASFGGNPAKVAHCYPCVVSPDGTTTGGKVSMTIKITFYAKLFNQNSSIIVD